MVRATYVVLACLLLLNISGLSLGLFQHQGPLFEQDKEEEQETRDSGDLIDLSYKECNPQDSSCKVIKMKVPVLPPGPPPNWEIEDVQSSRSHHRSKRRIFGEDNRLRIRYPDTQRYPFNSVVAIRTNINRCSGIALRPNMFLTAAHCIRPLNGERVWSIEVGNLNGSDTKMTWYPVKATKINVNWEGRTDYRRFMYDYAIVETFDNLDVETMRIAVIKKWGVVRDILKTRRPYMFFSAYDDRDIPSALRLRNCRMSKVTSKMIYSKCDTVAETAGAGVYLSVRSTSDAYKSGKKVIAIDTGDLQTGSRIQQRYSVALRISRRLFAQICYWVTGIYEACSGSEI